MRAAKSYEEPALGEGGRIDKGRDVPWYGPLAKVSL